MIRNVNFEVSLSYIVENMSQNENLSKNINTRIGYDMILPLRWLSRLRHWLPSLTT